MNNNDILRRIGSILNLKEMEIVKIFSLKNIDIKSDQVNNWLKEINEPGYQKLDDQYLSPFLNGLIDYKRGKKEDAAPREEKRLNNNIIFMKLKIALDLKADDILEIMSLADTPLRKLELSALFRNPGNKHYRECKDSVLEGFFQGLEIKDSRLL